MKLRTKKVSRTILSVDEQDYCCDRMKQASHNGMLFLQLEPYPCFEINYSDQYIRCLKPDLDLKHGEYCPYCGKRLTL